MAHPGPSHHPSGSRHSSGSHKCSAHTVAVLVHGTVDPSTAAITVTSGSVSSGMLVVHVTRTNHWAKADKSATPTSHVGFALGPKTAVALDGGTSDISS